MVNKALPDLKPGENAIVSKLRTTGAMRRRFLDIGLVQGTQVECIGKSPLGDPSAYMIRGSVIAIRREDSRGILISLQGDADGVDA